MREFFESWHPHSDTLEIIEQANHIIDDYSDQGYDLTLRQLYYQFVARDLLPNTERSYKNLGNKITKARMAGMISWNAIEDRTRNHKSFWTDENPLNPITSAPHYIRFDQWERQETYMEVWVEKEALGNVVSRACDEYLVPHLACKGYLSASEMYDAAKRFEVARENNKHCVLIHLGDHDPSGIDMTRDNDDRIQLLSNQSGVELKRIALNIEQVREYDPPPNPTKLKDSRAKQYLKRYGNTSWELDALEPSVIEELITNNILDYLDLDVWEKTKKKEKLVKDKLRKLGDNWDQVSEFLKSL